ncbi:hypothetical protein ANAEL_02315 [Anaerolineales bacterium]|nr:hypothetical protein ANAEL_02315 [Anaerolineales bacterium]
MKLKVLKNCKKGPYVEFNSTGKHWEDSSIFLEEVVFGVFSRCFDGSNENFNYFGATTFKEIELLSLHGALKRFRTDLDEISDTETFTKFILFEPIGKNFLHELTTIDKIDLNQNWKKIIKSLKDITETLLNLAMNCIEKKNVLWVLGI